MKKVSVSYRCSYNVLYPYNNICSYEDIFIGEAKIEELAKKRAIEKACKAGWKSFNGVEKLFCCPGCVKRVTDCGRKEELKKIA